MIIPPRPALILSACALVAGSAHASELSYTFLDFQYIQQSVEASGVQFPVPTQLVGVTADEGDGVSVRGSAALGDRFFISGYFHTSIIDVAGTVTNPLGTTEVFDNFDLLSSNLAFGFYQPFGDNFDLIGALSFDSAELDFGSFAGENFDMDDTGAGLGIGFRWNPRPIFELSALARYTAVGEPRLTELEFESDTLFHLAARWYFLEDLAAGVEYESGRVDTLMISLRFSFGRLPL